MPGHVDSAPLSAARWVPTFVAAALAFGPAASAAQVSPAPEVVERVFAEWDREGSPGCAVGVYERGEVTFARGFGEANLDWGIPITPSTVFYAGSVSKQFTAATAALLHLDGTIDLDDEVRSYIPELPAYDPPVTIRHLVHHTSGVRDIYGLIGLSGGRTADAWTDEEYLELITGQSELNFPAGSAYLYSNGAYFLLTTLLERVSGKRLDELARERIFAPLGMHDTHFHQESTRIVPRRAMSYGGTAESGFRQTYMSTFDKAGAGGLYTTIEDLAAWDRNFETGAVGGAEFLALIQTRGTLTSGDTLGYAFGLTHGEADGRRTVGHSGSFMGFRADFVRFPEEGVSVAVLCNLGGIDPSSLTRRVAREALGEAAVASVGEASEAEAASPGSGEGGAGEREPPPDPASAALRDYAGVYTSRDVGATIEVLWTAAGLRAVRPGSTSSDPLLWEGGDRFRLGGWTLEFEPGEGAERGPEAFRLDAGRVRNLLFTKRTDPG